MTQPHTPLATATSSHPRTRGASGNRTRALRSSLPDGHQGAPIEHCYRALLETSSSAILILSPQSIIQGWNRAAETLSGWRADEAMGQSYVTLCLPMDARKSFLATLAQVTAGHEARGFESPLRTRTNSQTRLSWNISRVPGTHGNLIGLMAIGTALAPQRETERKLQLAQTRLREEARRTQKAAEEERRRIARELHDEFGQALTGLQFDLAWCHTKLTQPPAPPSLTDLQEKIRIMADSVDALLQSVRATAASLRPAMLDDLGLIPALECLVATFQHRTGARCVLDITPELSSTELSPEISTALFRIAQELLTNVMRHAAASQLHLRLYQGDGRATLEVTDNGKGISRDRKTAPHSFGLQGIQERAALLGGHFHIIETPGVGTTAIASLPLAERFTP
ncbi:MAG: histidine kinase [Nitrospirae bacterium]|nr:histidine kinase [Nitrospirota bacterium]